MYDSHTFVIITYCNFGLQEKIYLSVEVTISTERFNWNWKSHCTLTSSCWKSVSFSLSKLSFAQMKSLHVSIVVTCSFLSYLEGNFKSWMFRVTARAYGLYFGLLRTHSLWDIFSLHHASPWTTALTVCPFSFLSHRTVQREGSSDQVNCSYYFG